MSKLLAIVLGGIHCWNRPVHKWFEITAWRPLKVLLVLHFCVFLLPSSSILIREFFHFLPSVFSFFLGWPIKKRCLQQIENASMHHNFREGKRESNHLTHHRQTFCPQVQHLSSFHFTHMFKILAVFTSPTRSTSICTQCHVPEWVPSPHRRQCGTDYYSTFNLCSWRQIIKTHMNFGDSSY